MSKVETDFILKNLQPYLKGLAEAKRANEALNTKSSNTVDNELAKAQANIKRYQSENLRAEKELTRQMEREAKSRADVQIKEAKRANDAQIRELKNLERERKQADAEFNQKFQNFRTGAATGALTLFGGAALFGVEALNAAKESTAANRALASSAIEAGKSYSVLADEAKRFGEIAGLSNTEAAKSAAQLQRLLTLAGRPDEFGKYSQGFLDVASARGENFDQLSNLFQGLISGTDDALNRFGKEDPGKLKERYAKELGKTTEELTQQEEILSRLKVFENDFSIFSGANEDRIKSTTGQIELASKSLNNLTTNVGLAISGNYQFQQSLELINSLLKEMIGLSEKEIVYKIRVENKTPRQIATEEADKSGNAFTRGVGQYGTIVAAPFVYGYDVLTKGFEEAGRNYDAALDVDASREREIEARTGQIESTVKSLDMKDALALAQRLKQINDSITNSIPKNTSKSVLKSFNLEIKEADENLGKLSDILAKVKADIYLEKDTKSTLIDSLEDKIKALTERLQKLRIEAKKTFDEAVKNLYTTASGGNPFVSIFAEGQQAIESFTEKFKESSPQLVREFRKVINETTRLKVAIQQFENSNKAFDLRQRGRELGRLLPTERGGYGRRLSGLQEVLGFAGESANYTQQAYLDRLLAARPFYQTNPALEQLQNYSSISARFDQLAKQFGNLGIYGQAAIAQAKLGALPDSQTLVALAQQGNRFASYGLNQRADLQDILGQASEQRIKDTFFRENRLKTSISEQLAYIDKIGRQGGVPTSSRLDEIINRYDRIGAENLNQTDLNQMINILNRRADVLDKEKALANKVMGKLDKLLPDQGGIPVDFGNQAPFQIDIKSSNLSIQGQRLPQR